MPETSIEVIVERFDNFKEYMKDITEKGFQGIHRRLDENDKAHTKLDENQKYTNGNVKRLQLWKAGLATGLAVTIFVATYSLRDYIEFKKAFYQSNKNSIELLAKINEQEKLISESKQSDALILDKVKQQEEVLSSIKDYFEQYNIEITQ